MESQEKLILVAILAGLMLFVVFFELRVMRGKNKKVLHATQKKDEAFNAILTTRHVINVIQRQGGDTRAAQSVLEEAKYSMQKGEYDEAMDLAEKARHELTHPSEPTPAPGVSDLEKVAEEVLATPKEDADLYTGMKLPDEQTGSYLSAQFELNGARDDVKKATAMGRDVASAQDLLAEADAAFEQGNYTKVLSLSVRARKTIGVGGAIETIPLKSPGPAEVAEEPPPQARETRQRGNVCTKCGELLEKGDSFCGKCGARVIVERTCENCGERARAKDKFCRKCGGKVA
jgi:tetratricopeptide (TPR) repeat protein